MLDFEKILRFQNWWDIVWEAVSFFNYRRTTEKQNLKPIPTEPHAASYKMPDNIDSHRYRHYGDPISMFDSGAKSNFKQSALEHYAMGGTAPKEIWNGLLDAHSYDKFDKHKVSDEAYHHQPMF